MASPPNNKVRVSATGNSIASISLLADVFLLVTCVQATDISRAAIKYFIIDFRLWLELFLEVFVSYYYNFILS